ncbi:MAG: GNAT family N-acetyltransferase [Thermoplasmata archaeon]|nr:GNAT family N-acetyltransferase [Thermoplasmata archaeon]
MELVKARDDDIERIMKLVSDCVASMGKAGQTQWNEDYPTREMVARDIKAGTLHTLRNELGHLIAMVTMDEEQELVYGDVAWRFTDGKVIIFHRMAILPEYQGRGLAGLFQDLMDDKARELGYTIARLDTYSDHERVIGFLERRGFEKAGQVEHVPGLKPFICFEKVL